jgi:signal transduction histidine kinase
LAVVIADNGRGFDANAAVSEGEHNGLGNMKRRAEAVGGQLDISSIPGRGTRMEFKAAFAG